MSDKYEGMERVTRYNGGTTLTVWEDDFNSQEYYAVSQPMVRAGAYDQLEAENKRLIDNAHDSSEMAAFDSAWASRVKAENKKLREALEWYAVNSGTIGKRARAALDE